MKKLFTNLMLACLTALVLSSCHSREKIVYIQGAAGNSYANASSYDIKVHKDNYLSILVTCEDQDLAVPFNLTRPSSTRFGGSGSSTSSYQAVGQETLLYWVDPEGNINFPILGKLHVEGLTRKEVSDLITKQIQEKGYIQQPVVNVTFSGAHYSVLGEVNRPGVFNMSSDRVTLFDAVAQAGDLTIFGERHKVRLIREENGEQQVVALNLKDPNIITSPYFYMHQNDILYVEPNGTRAANREVSSLASFAISVTSILITVTNFIITLTR